MGTNEYSQPASKSSWDSQDFGDVNMVVKMAHFHKSSRPQWVKWDSNRNSCIFLSKNMVRKSRRAHVRHFVLASMW